MAKKQVVIPDVDETVMRIAAIQAASTLKNASHLELIAKADAILDFIDPYADDEGFELIFTPEGGS